MAEMNSGTTESFGKRVANDVFADAFENGISCTPLYCIFVESVPRKYSKGHQTRLFERSQQKMLDELLHDLNRGCDIAHATNLLSNCTYSTDPGITILPAFNVEDLANSVNSRGGDSYDWCFHGTCFATVHVWRDGIASH